MAPDSARLAQTLAELVRIPSVNPFDGPARPGHREQELALDLIARCRLGLAGDGWTMIGIDPEGFDLRRGTALERADFQEPISDAPSARAALVRLTKESRGKQD